MTVVPGHSSDTVEMICDRCGAAVTASASDVRDTDLVWPLTTARGWTGSPFAVGPHQCPACATNVLLRNADRDPAPRAPHGDRGPRIDYEPAAAVVRLDGDIDVLVADALRQALTVAGAARRPVVLDLAGVGLIDSTGLGVLVRAHRELKQRGGSLCLAAPSRFVVAVLHTMRLEPVFPIFDDRSQALAHLGQRPSTTGTGPAGP